MGGVFFLFCFCVVVCVVFCVGEDETFSYSGELMRLQRGINSIQRGINNCTADC